MWFIIITIFCHNCKITIYSPWIYFFPFYFFLHFMYNPSTVLEDISNFCFFEFLFFWKKNHFEDLSNNRFQTWEYICCVWLSTAVSFYMLGCLFYIVKLTTRLLKCSNDPYNISFKFFFYFPTFKLPQH